MSSPMTDPMTQPAGVVVQPAAVQPAPPAASAVLPQALGAPAPLAEAPPQEVRLYSHSNFYFWWPVWAVGYLLALLTYLGGHAEQIGGAQVLIHPSKNVGVLFTLTFFLVVVITNISLRGLASVVVILAAAFLVLLLAYFHVWADVLGYLGMVAIYMNLSFYVVFATLIFLAWASSVFVYDRLSYWKVRPGQITHETLFGAGERSYDTRGMLFEKHREDLFRHWVLGLGSGDLEISTTGAKSETIRVPNVLFVNTKVQQIQQLIAMKPTAAGVAPPA